MSETAKTPGGADLVRTTYAAPAPRVLHQITDGAGLLTRRRRRPVREVACGLFSKSHNRGKLRVTSSLAVLTVAAITLLLAIASAHAQELKTYRKTAVFEDVKFDLTNAIIRRGLVIDFNGNLGGMLERTGKDVGSTKVIYKAAEYFMFCSAKLSRDMMTADAANVGFCPYVVFIYATAAKPGEVVVGYRRPPPVGSVRSRKVFAAIDTLLNGIAKEATVK